MAINVKCPKCGSTKVQLSNESNKHGCLYMVLFGIWYFMWMIYKWMIGMMIFMFYDWWMAIVHATAGKGHVWQSKRWFSNRRRIYFAMIVDIILGHKENIRFLTGEEKANGLLRKSVCFSTTFVLAGK